MIISATIVSISALILVSAGNSPGNQKDVVKIKTIAKEVSSDGDLYLQVGIFSVAANAVKLQKTLKGNDLPVRVDKVKSRKGASRRGVYVGPFFSEGGALLVKDRIREITGINPILVNRYIPVERIEKKSIQSPGAVIQPSKTVPRGTDRVGMSSMPGNKNILKKKDKILPPDDGKAEGLPAGEAKSPENEVRGKGSSSPNRVASSRGNRGDRFAGISMDFTDVDISALIKFISEITGKNFIYDERVRGKITIVSPRKITVKEAYRVFVSVLQVKGFTTIDQGKMVKIVPLRQAKQEGLKTYTRRGGSLSDEFITQLIPLKNIKARAAATLLAPLVSKEGLLSSYEPSNTLIIIDRGSNISRIQNIISELDIDQAAQVIRLYHLENAPVEEVTDILSQLFDALGGSVSVGASRRRTNAKRDSTSRAFQGIKFISDTRTNSLIVLSPRDSIGRIESMVSKLDVPAPKNVGKINVFYLENADSEELTAVLNQLINGTSGKTQTAARGRPSNIKSIISPEFEGAIKITADKATNSLIIVASPNDYNTLVGVIQKLDIKRRQVYVEAALMEINITDNKALGVEYRGAFEPTGSSAAFGGSNYNFTGNINDLLVSLAQGNPLLFSGEGLTAGVIGGRVILPDGTEIPAITAILRAAQQAENVHVLATPHLLTTDNEEAEIIVGENVPFITSQQRDSTNLANIINSIDRQDVGITLRLTPQIHESKYVKLDIYQESSAIKEGTSNLDPNLVGPTTTKRSAKTSIIVKSNQTIVLGGLMQTRSFKNVSKIPLLGDIPLLGWLFRFESENTEKVNFLLFLTPHIIADTADLTGISLQMKKKTEKSVDWEQNSRIKKFYKIYKDQITIEGE